MSFLTPAFLLLGLLAAPIIVMYMLRLRRREVMVSSTLLWQKLLRDREANAPWQKLRRNLLLILQLLILAALVLALARPFFPVPSVISGNTVVLLDGSASMQAADVAPNRFAAAKAEVATLIDDLGGDSRMTLIQVGQTPVVLAAATGDKTTLRRALEAAEPETAVPDWPSALALAGGAAQGFRDGRIVIVSDGGLPADLPPLPAAPIYLPIGESAELEGLLVEPCLDDCLIDAVGHLTVSRAVVAGEEYSFGTPGFGGQGRFGAANAPQGRHAAQFARRGNMVPGNGPGRMNASRTRAYPGGRRGDDAEDWIPGMGRWATPDA